MRAAFLSATLSFCFASAQAEPPRVVTDILPTQAIVTDVMAGIGSPALLTDASADPHHVTLRPSQARALSNADLVVWIGPSLSPWIESAEGTLFDAGTSLRLAELDGIALHAPRTAEGFAGHDHGHDDDNHGHGHDDDDDHDDHHDTQDSHDTHDMHGDHDDHPAADPHIWLDPQNAILMAQSIAAALAAKDPENEARYLANAEDFAGRVRKTEAALKAALADRQTATMIASHDVTQYFEAHFGVRVDGAVALSNAERPGAAHLRDLRDLLSGKPNPCLMAEPQAPRQAVRALEEDSGARVVVLDALGINLASPAAYTDILQGVGDSFLACTAPG